MNTEKKPKIKSLKAYLRKVDSPLSEALAERIQINWDKLANAMALLSTQQVDDFYSVILICEAFSKRLAIDWSILANTIMCLSTEQIDKFYEVVRHEIEVQLETRERIWKKHLAWLSSAEIVEKTRKQDTYKADVSPRIYRLIKIRDEQLVELRVLHSLRDQLLKRRDAVAATPEVA